MALKNESFDKQIKRLKKTESFLIQGFVLVFIIILMVLLLAL